MVKGSRSERTRSHGTDTGRINHYSKISQELSDKFSPKSARKYYCKCPLCHNNPNAKVQRSRSCEAEVRIVCLTKASFSNLLGQVLLLAEIVSSCAWTATTMLSVF